MFTFHDLLDEPVPFEQDLRDLLATPTVFAPTPTLVDDGIGEVFLSDAEFATLLGHPADTRVSRLIDDLVQHRTGGVTRLGE